MNVSRSTRMNNTKMRFTAWIQLILIWSDKTCPDCAEHSLGKGYAASAEEPVDIEKERKKKSSSRELGCHMSLY